MKKLIYALLMVVFVVGTITPAASQQTQKELRKALKKNPIRDARKEARNYKKDGFFVAPGALPMGKQLEKAWMRQYEIDEETGFDKYIVGNGQSIGETQTAAKLQATEVARLDLATKIQGTIAALIENNIANQQLNNEDAASVTKTVAASKNIIAQELGRIIPLFEAYREKGKNMESVIRLGYNQEMAMEAAKKVIRNKLEEETDLLQEKLEKLMDF